MDYRNYSAEDFALDEKFQKWVLAPDPEVKSFWEEWLRNNPAKKNVIEEAGELVRAAGLSTDHQTNEAYLSVWTTLKENATQSKPKPHFQYARIAAVLVFLIVSSFVLWRILYTGQSLEYRTAYGEIKEFALEDGSKVTLNSNSHLKLTSNWNERSTREVMLQGEAFFDVVKTADRKGFEVATNEDVRISVLGTKFNVNTRHEEVKVFLESGKVKVNSAIGEALMNPGDFVLYKSGNAALTINRNLAENDQLLSWKEQIFVFNDAPLSDVVRELEDNYGFNVIIEDKKLNEKRITAKIPRNDVDVLLNVLSEALDLKVVKDGNRLTLK